MTSATGLFSSLFYFLVKPGKEIEMIYKLTPKKSRDVKTLIEAETKKAAILYFAAFLHLSAYDLLQIYKIH